jgi:hypothetical protein
MNRGLKTIAMPGLHWTLGLIVLLQSFHFAFSPQTGFPQWIRPVLAGSEIIAALLFLTSTASVVSGFLLLFIFAIAIDVHFHHSQFDVRALVVYGMATIVCMTHREKEIEEGGT